MNIYDQRRLYKEMNDSFRNVIDMFQYEALDDLVGRRILDVCRRHCRELKVIFGLNCVPHMDFGSTTQVDFLPETEFDQRLMIKLQDLVS